jgi:outer membrane protein OmpA-like peptidoglycan-associated protein
MFRKITIMTFVMAMTCSLTILAQSDAFTTPEIADEMTKDADQNAKWRNGEYSYSAKPKNAWELGIHVGHLMINGDVATRLLGGYGLGLHVRRAVNYAFSVRMDLYYGQYKSWDVRETSAAVMSSERFYRQNLSGSQAIIDQYGANNEPFVRNFKTTVFGGSIQGLINIGNILFHQERNKWGSYGLVGIGVYAPDVKLNLRNGSNGVYDFSSAFNGLDSDKKKDRKDIRNNVKDLLDDDYESDGAYENQVALFGDQKDIIPSFHLGIGVSRKLGKRVNLTLEHQVIFSDNDLLDGYEFRTQLDETNNLDIINYTNLRVNINLGKFDKRTEPLYWLNPLSPGFNDISELKQRPKLDLTDTDGDGVIDMLDAEINSPEGCAVDTRGIALDSDGDGVIDCKDQEKFSPSGYPINAVGVAQIPEGPKYLTEDDVNKIVNNKIGGMQQRDWWLPMIHFDLDKYYIKPEFYSQLYHVATVMKANPSIRVVAKGHTDVRNPNDYNRVLSFNRANAAIDYLVSKHGIERDRLVLQYGGEEQPIVSDLPDSHSIDKEKEYQQYINRRVEFSIAQPGDESMGRPTGPEAGQGTPRSSRPGSKYSGNSNSGY